MQGFEEHRQRAFSVWLRTGRRVRFPDDRAIERKFNPWHDPDDGRFTFAGAGRHAGAGGGRSATPVSRRVPKIEYVEDVRKPPLASLAEADAWRARELAKYRGNPAYAEAIEARYRRYETAFAPQASGTLSRATRLAGDFIGGVGEGVYDTGKGTATGLYSLATTNPLTTIGNVGRGIAGAIDGAISAEDTPAYVQMSRAANAIANTSAHDAGHALGVVGTSGLLAVAPGAVAVRIAAAGRVGEIAETATAEARLGVSTSRNYRKTFFGAYPGTKGAVVVHHAVEQRVLRDFPGIISESEMHSLENLRGIPNKLNSKLHLDLIRKDMDDFYLEIENGNIKPTKEAFLKNATDIDRKYGHQFRPAR